MKPKNERQAEKKDSKPQEANKSANPKQVGERANIQQNTSNRRHQRQREER